MDWSLKNFYTYAQDLLAPPRCTHCHKALHTREVFCSTCINLVQPVLPYFIPLNAHMIMPVHAAASYDGPLRTLILQKHAANISGCYALAQLILQRTPFQQAPDSIVIPVPLHWTRRYSRGFNQAEEIALHLAHYNNTPVMPLVKRHKKTLFQSTLSKVQRKENVAQAFMLHATVQQKNTLKDKNLIIVDDLMTSGNTLYYTARCLLPLKPKSITAFVACRACLR